MKLGGWTIVSVVLSIWAIVLTGVVSTVAFWDDIVLQASSRDIMITESIDARYEDGIVYIYPINTFTEDFSATWIVEVNDITDGLTTRCKEGVNAIGSGSNIYKRRERTEGRHTLSWWIGKDCTLKPGRYSVATSWQISAHNDGARQTVFVETKSFDVP